MRALVLMAVSAHVSAVVFNHAQLQFSNARALLSKRSGDPFCCYDDCQVIEEPKPFNSTQTKLEYPEVQQARPVAWVHIPKAGSGLVNSLYQHPGICPGSTEDMVVPVASYPFECPGPVGDFVSRYPEETFCPDSTYSTFPIKLSTTHWSVHMEYDRVKGNIMSMFRQPEQRLISAYHNYQHGWMNLSSPPANLSHFAEEMQGCQTKMLARGTESEPKPCLVFNPYPPTEEETDLAVSRVREGFSFIGLTEQWDLSICLFHAMYGAKCTDAEFMNTRLGSARDGEDEDQDLYDTTELYGFHDKSDGRVYAEAERIFNENLVKYGVDSSSCPSMCQ